MTLRERMGPLLRTLIALMTFVVALALLQSHTVKAQASESSNQDANAATFLPTVANNGASAVYPPLCRFGVNGGVGGYPVEMLRIGWYLDYTANSNPARPNGIEFAPVIRLRQSAQSADGYYFFFARPNLGINAPSLKEQAATVDELKAMIKSLPGAYWFIGNEPERRGTDQDDLEPHIYARAYHDLYHLIKAEDPTAKILAGSIVQPTPLRLKYLDLVLNSYFANYGEALPVDGWSIHNFILNEASCSFYGDSQICWGAEIPRGLDDIEGERIGIGENDDIERFTQQIWDFRQWMADRGYRGVPVFLSEYGVLMPANYDPPRGYPPERVNEFMDATFDFVLNTTDPELGDPTDDFRLIQRLSWYSVYDEVYNGDLFTNENGQKVLSAMGQNYRDYTSRLDEATKLYTVRTWTDSPALATSSGQVTLTVSAQIANSGNTMSKQPFVARFYDGDPAQGGVQIGADQQAELAGCGEDTVVQVQWPDADPVAAEDIFVEIIHVLPGQPVVAASSRSNVSSQCLFHSTENILIPQ